MSDPVPDPLEPDAPEADILEQRRTASWDDEEDVPHAPQSPTEANEADVAEQELYVEDDEEYPRDNE
ncbi:hypothetical protein [Arthrobacter castelli]|uniref:hypothetical protein n=1 Tax=Arthrobacter castelli TaxID=271431 RepID=UPI00041ABF60|nr:hypothetical protein [Arthrobacter castelli]